MRGTPLDLPLPQEPSELKARTRELVERSPRDGLRVVAEGRFLADALWPTWGVCLTGAGMSYDAFLGVVRSYGGEIRLWVMGERPWEDCASGVAGRVSRRIPVGMARVA